MVAAAFMLLDTCEQRNELADFYERYKRRFFTVALKKLHNIENAEDAIQETFLRIVKYPNKFFELSENEKKSYAVMVCKNVCADFMKKKLNRRNNDLPEEIADKSQNVEKTALENVSRAELKRFVEQMPAGQRDAITLKMCFDYSNKQIARTLGISKTAAAKRVSNAYKALREFYKGEL